MTSFSGESAMIATFACPRCGEEIGNQARICANCGASGSQLFGPAKLYEIAYSQKLVLYAVLVSLLLFLAYLVSADCATVAPPLSEPLALVLASLLVVVGFFSLVLSVWSWYRLALALGMAFWKVIVSEILLFLPIASTVALLMLTVRATRMLQMAGVEVGLMGANLRTMPRGG
jgi:hypothetical protein